LHHAAFGAAGRPRVLTRRCRPRRAERGSVVIATQLGEQIGLRIAGRRASLTIRLDARTRVDGPPWLAAGTRVRVRLRQCPGSNKPVATAIVRL
jgi:hypothetical protein